jgi:hypothetical protein|mmetsp:Transcript_28682/g.46176  ORF Transcript_28682/g.46176 Transcript_28682/m.46176 type:complete len:552 (+) Transcript_28682:128-1783(+)
MALIEKEGKNSWKLHVQGVVRYDWLVAISIAPIAFAVAFILAVLLPEAAQKPWSPPPIAILCIAGYCFFEATAFCLERNWSRVSVWRFWRVAGPFAALQAFLCFRLTQHDVLGCLLFVCLCLGCREFLFEFQALCENTGKSSLHSGTVLSTLTSAFFGGSTYGFAVALLCGLAGTLVHAVVGDGRLIHSTVMLEVLCILALPLGRNFLRMALNRTLMAVTTAGLESTEAPPKLDVLVMYSDILFLLTMFLEATFAFVFLLVPNTMTFYVALIVNLVIDALFPRAMVDQAFERFTSDPNSLALTRSISRASDDSAKLSARTGKEDLPYCLDRPESFFLVLAHGASLSDISDEASPLRPHGNNSGANDYSQYPEFVLPYLLWWREAWQRLGIDAPVEVGNPMSPRISCLLEKQDDLVVGCRAGNKETYAFLQQARMIALNTHFLGSTLGLFLVIIAIPVAKYASDNNHTEFLGLQHLSAGDLALRVVFALAVRVLADLLALGILEKNTHGSDGIVAAPFAFWECRHELSTFNGCVFRVLAATCPLFSIIAATL